MGVGKFSKHCHLSRKQYKIDRYLLWNTNRNSLVPDRSVSVPMTLSDLQKGFKGREGSKFQADLHNYARTVWPIMTKFGTVTQVSRSIFLCGQPRPRLKGRDPKIFVTSYMRSHNSMQNLVIVSNIVPQLETITKFCIAIKLDVKEISQSLPQMLTRDLFVVANVLVFIHALAAQQPHFGRFSSFNCKLKILNTYVRKFTRQNQKIFNGGACMTIDDVFSLTDDLSFVEEKYCHQSSCMRGGWIRFRVRMQSAILLLQICPSVRLSVAGTVSKRMDISSNFSTIW